jgi:hypothetical protein
MNATGSLSKSQLVALDKIMRIIRDNDLKMLKIDPKQEDEVLNRLAEMTSESTHSTKK